MANPKEPGEAHTAVMPNHGNPSETSTTDINDGKPAIESPRVHLLRHGQSLHNIDRTYPHRDPPLTSLGHTATSQIRLDAAPDIIVISPMTRTIQTALNAFPSLIDTSPFEVPVQIWPELREAHDAICNKGLSREAIQAKFPQFDFRECSGEWDYEAHTVERATARAEGVRRRLKSLVDEGFKDVVVVTHRGLIAYLVKGERFDVCESRSYRLAQEEEVEDERRGINKDTNLDQDFGPTVLVPYQVQGASENGPIR